MSRAVNAFVPGRVKGFGTIGIENLAIMTLEDVKERLRTLIEQIHSAPQQTIRDETTLEELQLSSVAFVELQVAIEDAFDLVLDPVEVVELNEFGRIASLVHTKAKTSPS